MPLDQRRAGQCGKGRESGTQLEPDGWRSGSALEYGVKGIHHAPPQRALFRKRVPAGVQLGAHLQGRVLGCYDVTLLWSESWGLVGVLVPAGDPRTHYCDFGPVTLSEEVAVIETTTDADWAAVRLASSSGLENTPFGAADDHPIHHPGPSPR